MEDGKTSVLASVTCNIDSLEDVRNGLPGAPENFKIIQFEEEDGSIVDDEKKSPPNTVYVIGTVRRK